MKIWILTILTLLCTAGCGPTDEELKEKMKIEAETKKAEVAFKKSEAQEIFALENFIAMVRTVLDDSSVVIRGGRFYSELPQTEVSFDYSGKFTNVVLCGYDAIGNNAKKDDSDFVKDITDAAKSSYAVVAPYDNTAQRFSSDPKGVKVIVVKPLTSDNDFIRYCINPPTDSLWTPEKVVGLNELKDAFITINGVRLH